MKKSIIAVLAATLIMLSALGPVLLIQTARGADPTDWYKTVPGVLDSDTYALYPFAAKSLTIGMSKFGEMIDANTKIGLSYGPTDLDPFANEAYVPEFEWNQGWLINITYSYSGEYRNVWAFALYSDSYSTSSIGGDWKRADSPDSTTIVGGRKYGGYRYGNGTYVPIGYATTETLTVLYDGPRRFVALAKTTVGEDASTPLVGVYITFVFDKVKKYVVLYKDVKLLDDRKFSGILSVEFSNRGEWDLGKTTAPASYAHFYTGLSTDYEEGYHPFYAMGIDDQAPPAYFDVAQTISTDPTGFVGFAAFWPSLISRHMEATYLTDRTRMLTSLETYTADFKGDGSTTLFSLTPDNPAPVAYPRGAGVWDDAPMVFVDGKIRPRDPADPLGYTWSTPVVSFNQPPGNGAKIWVVYKQPVNKVDMSDEPKTPYIIAEWDFDLSWADESMSTNHFRGVTVYGVVDNHDALDTNAPAVPMNQLDREVMYQLDEVFNPWGLNDAANKNTARWVEFSKNPIGSTIFNFTNAPTNNVADDEWDQYGVFSERVEDLTTGKVLNRWKAQYTFTVDANGYGHIGGLNASHYYKFLYSTYNEAGPTPGRYEWITVGRDAHTVDSAGSALVAAEFKDAGIEIGNAGMDMEGVSYAYEIPWLLGRYGSGTTFQNYWITPDSTSPGQRLTLRDDWCTNWPVASSNIIGIGGPLANQITGYFNQFTDAFYSEPWFTPYTPAKGTLMALPCWSKNAYANDGVLNGTGYAMVGTYLDINGTVGLVIYGLDGRDTFYASKFFKDYDMYELQTVPLGVTSIVLEIDYTDWKHPDFTLVEVLGTISEYNDWLHPDP